MMKQDELDGGKLAEKLIEFMNNRELLVNMGESVRKIARPDAAKVIVNRMCELMGRN